jgi:hypothetical protein
MTTKFKVGDKVLALKETKFIGGSWHLKNSKHVVTKETEAYYNHFDKDYDIIE